MEQYEEIKNHVAANIAELRRQYGMTQTEFAEKLNYSDKAVSKWERAESMPDIGVLKQIADIFFITLDELVSKDCKKKPGKITKLLRSHKLIIPFLSAGLVWLVATVVFVILSILEIKGPIHLAFVYAVPVSAVVLLVFSAIWGNKIISCVIVSILVWSIPLAVFLTITFEEAWLIFLIGVPLQILVILWYVMKFSAARKRKSTQ